MYKLIAIDLDGTMLNSYGEVTENTKRVLNKTKRSRSGYYFRKKYWFYKIYSFWNW